MMRLLHRLRSHSLLASLGNAIYPPQCPVCDEFLTHGQNIAALCYQCWDKLNFCDGLICDKCAMPMEAVTMPSEAGDEFSTCMACIDNPPRFDLVRSVFFYNEAIKTLLMRFKYSDRTDIRFMLSAWLESRTGDWLETCDYIIPVPLNYWRLLGRRYNQALLIAEGMQYPALRDKLIPDMLVRHRYTKPMKGMSARQRKLNLRGSMHVHPLWEGRLKGKSVLVVDDVFTSGATLNVCAGTLKAAGVAKVYVASLARVG